VRDHDHITGEYRGAAHSRCNLQLRSTYQIPLFIHNFRGYDQHLIIRALGDFDDVKIGVIGQTLEKYIMVKWSKHIQMKDSLMFLQASLDSLVACTKKSGVQNFVHLAKETHADLIPLLLRKGVSPYDYMNSLERMKETQLPAREHFRSTLTDSEISEEDYAHAQRVWREFGCKTMKDYHDVYLKADVLQLADVFETYRSKTLANFELDPAYYVSAPHLSWDCMLKMTQSRLELLSDPAMFRVSVMCCGVMATMNFINVTFVLL
jgi:hypothetical protein